MNILNISKKQFENLNLTHIPKNVYNTEAIIYDYTYKRKELIIKNLFNLEGATFANKLYSVEMLDAFKNYIPDNFVLPTHLFCVNHKIMGFAMPKIIGTNLSTILHEPSIDAKEKIYYLKRIGEILDNMKNIRKYSPLKDFYINDLHESNFMVEPLKKQIKVIDADSAKIANNFVFAARYLTPSSLAAKSKSTKYKKINNPFMPGYIKTSSDTDLYCYSIMILSFLFSKNISNIELEEFYTYLTYLDDLKLHHELIECFNNLLSNKPNINPSNLLDTITYEQLGKAKESIYKLNKH